MRTNVPKDLEGYYAEIGGFTYQGRGKTPGARLGLGINFTRYHIDAEKFFRGEYKYVMMTIILVTHTRITTHGVKLSGGR